MADYDVIIIGGGISGLAAAWRLRQDAPHLKAALVERHGRLGGKIQSERIDGFIMEAGPDCFLARKPRGVGLCEELGIADQLIGRNPAYQKTFVLRNGRLHRLPEGLTGMIPTDLDALSNTTLLSDAGRQAIQQEPWQAVKQTDADESLADFVTRRFGREAFENLIEPLMGGIFAGQADQLSLAATFPQLRQLEQQFGSVIEGLTRRPLTPEQKYPPFVSLPDGMGQLIETLVERLDGVEWLTGCEAKTIQSVDNWQLAISNRQLSIVNRQSSTTLDLPSNIRHLSTPTLILATPAFVSARLLQSIDPILAQALDNIPYASTALVNLTYREADLPTQLDGYGYVIPKAEGKEALACTWSSQKWPGRAPKEHLLLRVYIGRFGTDVTQYDDDRLQQIALNELAETLNIHVQPRLCQIQRWPDGMPQFNMGHLSRIDTIEARLSQHTGLYLAGNYFRGVGIPDAIKSAETAVAHLLEEQQIITH